MSNSKANVRLPAAVCAAVADILNGSHDALNELFFAAGAPGPPPDLAHHSKWKTWLQRVGNNPEVDSLSVLGALIEEFMDLPPVSTGKTELFRVDFPDPYETYKAKRERLVAVLEEHGFRYFRGGRVMPIEGTKKPNHSSGSETSAYPNSIEELLAVLVRGLPRAMHPLTHRRKGATSLEFHSEYDIQDLLHALLRPWVGDIRPEEHAPSYAGNNTRMDFLLPKYELVIETKRVRDKSHAKSVVNELLVDIEHYRKHPKCHRLWCVIYDPLCLIANQEGVVDDLSGERKTKDGSVEVQVYIFGST